MELSTRQESKFTTVNIFFWRVSKILMGHPYQFEISSLLKSEISMPKTPSKIFLERYSDCPSQLMRTQPVKHNPWWPPLSKVTTAEGPAALPTSGRLAVSCTSAPQQEEEMSSTSLPIKTTCPQTWELCWWIIQSSHALYTMESGPALRYETFHNRIVDVRKGPLYLCSHRNLVAT